MRPQAIIGRAPSRQFILMSFAAGLAFNLMPWGPEWPIPDLLAIILVFWNIFLPSRIGLAPAWLLGLIMDVHQGVLLGQHALAYSLLSYGAITLHRRIPDFTVWGQMAHLYPLFLLALASVYLIRWFVEGAVPTEMLLIQPLTEAVAFVLVSRSIQGLLQRKARPSRMKTKAGATGPSQA
ncbi:MAG: rod shape-determining protein MreD [Pseudomonadota bacterium]|jgi:rod shape-determining protein MreD